VEANIHYPTDAGLIQDGVRVVTRVVKQLKDMGVAVKASYRDHSRSIRKRILSIAKVLQRRSQASVDKVRQITGNIAEIAESTIQQARQVLETAKEQISQVAGTTIETAAAAGKRLESATALLEKVVDQAKTVNAGKTHISDRIVCVFDPSARPIRKGKLRAKVEFGYKLILGECEERVITSYQVLTGNPNDEILLESCLNEHVDTVNKTPQVIAADRGFSSKRNEEILEDKGVNKACIPRRGKKDRRRERLEHEHWFRHNQRWRAGIEASISVLKRQYGLAKSLSRSHKGVSC